MILFVGFLLMEIVMPQISRTALVPYSAEQMYQLVNDVQSYPQFLPGCTGSRILESTPGQMTALAFGRVFKELAANMVQAFTVRAKEVYSAR